MDILNLFSQKGFLTTVCITQRPLEGSEIAKEMSDGYDLVVCSGGDGTLDEIITGLMQKTGFRNPVGYIPAGSTNDFANSLALPKDMYEAATVITRDIPFPCDIGSFNDDYFVYIAAFGLFTDVSYQTNQDVKNVLGHMAYVLEGAKRLFNIKSYALTITTGDQVIVGDFVYGMVTNSVSVGGFKNITGKEVKFDDGVFEVTLIRTPRNVMELNEIIAALVTQEMDNKHIYSFKTAKVEIASDGMIPWTLDGENGGEHEYVKIENHNKAIQILVNDLPE